MLRASVGVIVSYVAMGVVVYLLVVAGVLLLGVEHFFKTDSYEVSGLWAAISLLITIGSGIIGGLICAAISKSLTACKLLALIVIVTGVLISLPKIHDDPIVRAGEITTKEAVQLAQMPIWLYVASPMLAAAGILVGAGKKLRRKGAET